MNKISKANKKNVIKLIQEDKQFNLKTKKGFIFYVGGILSKLEGDIQFFAVDGKWVAVE